MKPSTRWITRTLGVIFVLISAAGCSEHKTAPVVATLTPSFTATSENTPTATATATPEPTPTATIPACMSEGGVVERVSLESSQLGTDLFATIYTPHCYDPEGDYPVLYLLHGQSMTDAFWFDLGVTQIADEAILKGQKPFMIVLPYEERNYDPPGGSKFDDAILNDLIPWVDSHYATCTDRSCRAIGGVSRGGGWAVDLVARHFDKFGALGAHSFGLMSADGWWFQNMLNYYDRSEFPRVYIDRGNEDYLYEGIEYFVNILAANKIPYEYHIYAGNHSVTYWQEHVKEYMYFYMDGWK